MKAAYVVYLVGGLTLLLLFASSYSLNLHQGASTYVSVSSDADQATEERNRLLSYPKTDSVGIASKEGVNERFDRECKYWVAQMDKWTSKVAQNRSGYNVIQERSGAGDRLSGLVTALNHAIQQSKPLSYYWKELDAVFQVPDTVKRLAGRQLITLNEGPEPKLAYGACQDRGYYACAYDLHKKDKCPVYNRACMSPNACLKIHALYEKQMTQVNVFGCALRLLIEPVRELLQFPIKYFMDGELQEGTVSELETKLSKFKVISIHLRVGDHTFGGISTFRLKPMMTDLKSCVTSIDELLSETTDKQIKWFVASDNPTMRDLLIEKFPEKVIMLKHKPRHLDAIKKIKTSQDERIELQNMFAEWYLLGKGDELLVNAAHEAGRGVSSFSRTAWLYTLRSQHYLLRNYDKSFCIRQEFQYEGNLNVPKECVVENEPIDQPHLVNVNMKKKKI